MSELQGAFERELDAIAHDAVVFRDWKSSARARVRLRGTTAFGVTIDRPGGVDLALCERIAARINAMLEAADRAYTLEVESAGVERPLVRPADYDAICRPARARRDDAHGQRSEDASRYAARACGGEPVMLETDGGELPLPIETIKSAQSGIRSARGFATQQTTTEEICMATTEHGN